MPAPRPRPATALMTNAVTIRILFALSPLTFINGVARLSEKRNHRHSTMPRLFAQRVGLARVRARRGAISSHAAMAAKIPRKKLNLMAGCWVWAELLLIR